MIGMRRKKGLISINRWVMIPSNVQYGGEKACVSVLCKRQENRDEGGGIHNPM